MVAITNQALVLLRSSSLSIAQIASELGFNNKEHFDDEFKTVCGMRPDSFRFKVEDDPEFTIILPEPEPIVNPYEDLTDEELAWFNTRCPLKLTSVPNEIRRIYGNDIYFEEMVFDINYFADLTLYLSKSNTDVKGIMVRPLHKNRYFKYLLQDLANLDPKYVCRIHEYDRKAVIRNINKTFGTKYRQSDIIPFKLSKEESESDSVEIIIEAHPDSIFLYGSTKLKLKKVPKR